MPARWMRLRWTGVLLLVSVFGVGPGVRAGQAAEENPHVWKPRLRSVAVFKNGLGFFMREGDVALHQGWCAAAEVPPATFGTLAIYAMDEKMAVDVVGAGPGEIVEFDGRDAPKDLDAKRARLEAVKQMEVELCYASKGQTHTSAGRLVSVGPEYVVLESEASSFAVPLEGLERLQVLGLPLRLHVSGDAEASPEKAPLGMAYLRKGITWLPDYTLKVLDEETAELTLRGTLVNDAEDLVHTDVHFVVGVPHFTHTEFMAPIAVGQMIRSIGAAIAPQAVPQQVTTQIMNRAAIVSNLERGAAEGPAVVERPAEGAGDVSDAIKNLPQLDSAAGTDYAVYTKKDLTLRRGEKAIVTLFSQRIRYGHIYRWPLPGAIEHSLVLHNATDSPWTTGPCLALSGDQPLTEDLLRYTPKGSGGELPVTAAINIAHEKTEAEVARKLKEHSPGNGVFFDLVTLEGTLTLQNYEKRPVEIRITNPVPGKPISAEADGALSSDSTKLRLVEREGAIGWRLVLQPDERKTIRYQYERYVPSN